MNKIQKLFKIISQYTSDVIKNISLNIVWFKFYFYVHIYRHSKCKLPQYIAMCTFTYKCTLYVNMHIDSVITYKCTLKYFPKATDLNVIYKFSINIT